MSGDQGITQKSHNDLVLSFLAVRRAIGALGFFLPFALIIYGIAAADIPGSISAAYYTPMREVFVGAMIAQAVFLYSYEGFRPEAGDMISDRATAQVAAICAALVALAPTAPENALSADPGLLLQQCTLLQCVMGAQAASLLHILAAFGFFAALAVYCLILFVKGEVDGQEKQASNRIYRICGWLIIASIGLAGLIIVTGADEYLAALNPVFWLETIACFAFATSWAVKGDAMRPLVRGVAALH